MEINVIISQELLNGIDKIFRGDQSNLIPVYSAIGGALIGGIISYFPQAWLRRSEKKESAKALEAALLAEMNSITDTIRERGYIEEINQIIIELDKEDSPYSKRKFYVIISPEYNRIFTTTAADIGTLKPSFANDVIRFYSKLDSAILDITKGGFLFEEGGNKKDFQTLRKLIIDATSISHSYQQGEQ